MKRLVPFLGALVLALAPLAFIHPVRIQGESMAPTLLDGELHVALRAWCAPSPKVGQVWVVRTPEGTAVKRVLASPGHRLALTAGRLSLDDQFLNEPYVVFPENGQAGPWLASGGYLLLGDNRPKSRDSRVWGPLPKETFESLIIH